LVIPGLTASGRITEETRTALNVPCSYRIEQIEANMERWRWLSRELPKDFLLINIADFRLLDIRQDSLFRAYKLIVGRDERKTPVFSATLTHLIVNPVWTIPPTILREDILPQIQKDTTYLQRKGIYVLKGRDTINPATITWTENNVHRYTFQQKPSYRNALGLIKFMFPNRYNVYLHDTPDKHLFWEDQRTFSSGCMRLQHPFEFAASIISDSLVDLDSLKRIVKSAKPSKIVLKKAPVIYILYWTAWADDGGQLHFRKDIYGRDDRLIRALKQPIPES
jgi:murein L,D-transpeptidase YcbB/YkuD